MSVLRRLDRLGHVGLRPFTDAYTGYMLRHHLYFIVVTFVVILAAVTAINVSGEIARVWAEGAGGGMGTAFGRTGLYLWCRLLDNGTQISGISFLLGLVWAEAAHAFGGRLLMVRTAGRTFLARSTALFVLAALWVPVQFSLDNFVRPWAFMTLSREGLGEYGWRFARDRTPSQRWYAFGNTVLRMNLHDSPAPVLEDAVLYTFDAHGGLAAVATADRIVPPGDGQDRWTMRGAVRWKIGDPADAAFGLPVARAGAADGGLDLGFAISPLWLEYRGIEPKYVPLADLWRFTGDPALPANRANYEAWLAIRMAQAVVSGLVGVCIGALFALVLDRRGLIVAAGGGLLTAYCGYFFNRIAALAVENLAVPPLITAFALPVVLAVTVLWLIVRLRRRETLS